MLIFEVELPRGTAAAGGSAGGNRSVKHAAAHGVGEAPHAEIVFGVLFETSDYTRDVTGKADMHVQF